MMIFCLLLVLILSLPILVKLKKILFFIVLFFFAAFLNAQVRKEVLFIGNSYTYVNDLPGLIADIAHSKGDTLFYDSNTPGGYTFQQHSTDPLTISKIKSNKWDYVILQEQSQRPSFPPEQVRLLVYPYADTLNRFIKTNDTCSAALFYMTWGRKNGDPEYCPVYPPVCTFEGMQSRLRQSYLEMTQMFNAQVAPVGIVWKLTRELHPEIELYEPDGSHPNLAGSYLAACTFYASLFHKSPVNAYIPPGLNLNNAHIIQNYAHSVVFDSLFTWNIDTATTNAAFTYTALQYGSVQFINKSRNANAYYWDFGDGNFSTEINPIHTYQFCGTSYLVLLKAFNGCQSDMFQSEVLVPCYGINECSTAKYFALFPNPAKNIINIHFYNEESNKNARLILYDCYGKLVFSYDNLTYKKNTLFLPELDDGIYFIQLVLKGECFNLKIQIIQD